MKEIIQKEHSILRETAKPVTVAEITGAKIRKIIAEMKKSLVSQEDGVAIAAPQIGVSLRIFVVSHRALEMLDTPDKKSIENPSLQMKKELPSEEEFERDLVFINPEVIKLSKKKICIEEGCLSVRWLYGNVKRSTNITVRAFDEKGVEFTRGAGGLLAQIFQHEIDHLDGILFTDKAKNIQEILPKNL